MQNAATLTVSAHRADGISTGQKVVDLVAMVPQFVSTYDQAAFQQAASIKFTVQFGLTVCGEGKAPILVLDVVDVAPVLVPSQEQPTEKAVATTPPEASSVNNVPAPANMVAPAGNGTIVTTNGTNNANDTTAIVGVSPNITNLNAPTVDAPNSTIANSNNTGTGTNNTANTPNQNSPTGVSAAPPPGEL